MRTKPNLLGLQLRPKRSAPRNKRFTAMEMDIPLSGIEGEFKEPRLVYSLLRFGIIPRKEEPDTYYVMHMLTRANVGPKFYDVLDAESIALDLEDNMHNQWPFDGSAYIDFCREAVSRILRAMKRRELPMGYTSADIDRIFEERVTVHGTGLFGRGYLIPMDDTGSAGIRMRKYVSELPTFAELTVNKMANATRYAR